MTLHIIFYGIGRGDNLGLLDSFAHLSFIQNISEPVNIIYSYNEVDSISNPRTHEFCSIHPVSIPKSIYGNPVNLIGSHQDKKKQQCMNLFDKIVDCCADIYNDNHNSFLYLLLQLEMLNRVAIEHSFAPSDSVFLLRDDLIYRADFESIYRTIQGDNLGIFNSLYAHGGLCDKFLAANSYIASAAMKRFLQIDDYIATSQNGQKIILTGEILLHESMKPFKKIYRPIRILKVRSNFRIEYMKRRGMIKRPLEFMNLKFDWFH